MPCDTVEMLSECSAVVMCLVFLEMYLAAQFSPLTSPRTVLIYTSTFILALQLLASLVWLKLEAQEKIISELWCRHLEKIVQATLIEDEKTSSLLGLHYCFILIPHSQGWVLKVLTQKMCYPFKLLLNVFALRWITLLSTSLPLFQWGWSLLSSKKWSDKRQWPHITLERFKLDVRWNFLTEKVLKHWNRLPKELAESSYLEVLKEAKVWC